MDIFVFQVGTRCRCIQPLLDRLRKYLEPFLTFLFSVTRVGTMGITQGGIALEEGERPNVKREEGYTDCLWDDKVHFGLDCVVTGCTEA